MKAKVAFLTLGCKVNSYETEAMEELFGRAGYEIVGFEESADIYIVNTCTVTNIADRKSRQMLHRARKNNRNAVVVAAGCYVQAPQSELKKDAGVDLLVGNNQKGEVVRLVEAFLEDKKITSLLCDIAGEKEYEALSIETAAEKTRAYIKIQDGCNQFCSYCMIPYVRGRIRSRDENQILEEVERIAAAGYKEVVLTGIHLSSYGVDRGGSPELLTLLQKMEAVHGLGRIRLGSLEPRIITEEFSSKLAELTKICPHFHLSLQSGSNSVLERMNRHYTVQEYMESCNILRSHFVHPAVTTDVITGFPGETEEEFLETKAFLGTVGFAALHVFPYSKRQGTKAESMPGQITETVKKQRCKDLILAGEELRGQEMEYFSGGTDQVLFEEEEKIDGGTYQVGYNTRYVRIAVKTAQDMGGRLAQVSGLQVFGKDKMIGVC